MNRRNVMDYLMMRRRNPYMGMPDYASRGGDRARGDRGEYRDYADRENSSMDRQQDYARGDRARGDRARGDRGDMGSRYPFMVGGEFGRYDGHYPYYPQMPMMYDYARGGDRGYDNARGRDRGNDYDYRDYNDYGDYGESLSKKELEHWNKKLMKELEEKDKQFFTKEMISQKARQMGIRMEDFKEEELLTASLMMYTDYNKTLKPYIGNNMEIYVAMGKAFLTDPDASVKGGEKLAVYYDCIVEGEDDD